MLPNLKTKKVRVMLVTGLVLMIGLAAYYLVALAPNSGNKLFVPGDSEAVKQDGKIKISADTDLVQKIVYTKCNDEEVFRTKPADNLIGLNYQQFQKVYSGWTIDKFDMQEVDMTLKVDSFCREHANNMFIGVKDGHVAVYYGKPGPKAILKEVTKIPLNKLMQEDVEELRRGHIVQSKEELMRTLEGMQAR